MNYQTARQVAEKWNISMTMVRRYCAQGRIEGAFCTDAGWLIPEDAQRPKKIEQPGDHKNKLYPLAMKIINQKNGRNYKGLYHYIQINLTYCSCRMASVRLTRNQMEMIFKKGKVPSGFEPLKVSDLIETLNHFCAADAILTSISEPLTQHYIVRLHGLLVARTVDERRKIVTPGVYRAEKVRERGYETCKPEEISKKLNSLIKTYESLPEVGRNDILAFHTHFEQLRPFEDYNGRLGRLLMFKECLRHNVMPFIIDDKRRADYLLSLQEWDTDPGRFSGMVLELQERFEKQIELQKMMANL